MNKTTSTPKNQSSKIYTQMALFSGFIAGLLGILHYFGKLGMYPGFAWVCFVFFTLLSFFVIALIAMTNQSSTPGRAVYLILGVMGLKFLFSILMVLAYMLAVQPQKVQFIIPFFFLYIAYSAIETHFLMKMVNKK